jgi:radical SAM protein with 4Fe4S-binding SPASM domain
MSLEGPQSETHQSTSTAYKDILKKTAKQHRLMAVHFELTYRCNERCTHCYLDVFKPNAIVPRELSTEECLNVIDQISSLGVLHLTLSGGDILVRRDWYEIAQYARQKRLLLRLFTNGLLIRPKLADRIASLHPYAVEISLYSTKPEIHESITRVKHSWELSTRAIKLLRERGVRVVMKTPLMRENVREIDDLFALAEELGAIFHYDVTITPKNSGALDPLKHRMGFEDLVWIMDKQISPGIWEKHRLSDEDRTCMVGGSGMVIDPYGNIFPCVELRRSAGNVRENSLEEIWKQSEVWPELSDLKVKDLPVCRACEIRTLCVRCHGLSFNESGDMKAPAKISCTEALARRQALIAKGLIEPEKYPLPLHLRSLESEMDGLNLEYEHIGVDFLPVQQIADLNL